MSAQKWQIYTAANPTVERVIPDLAVEIGLNESIMLLQIAYWISISDNERNGAFWTFQSIRDMQEKAFPYWSIATISRIIKSLKKKGYILVRTFNARKGDKTQWFALEPDKLSSLTSVLIQPMTTGNGVSKRNTVFQNETPMLQNETTLPETTTEITTESEEKTPAPKVAERPQNDWYNAVLEVWKYTAGMNTDMALMLQGIAKKKGYKEFNLATPITPDELRAWACWYRVVELKGNTELNMLEKHDKIQSSITYWQEVGKPDISGKSAKATAQIEDLASYVPPDPNEYIGVQNNVA